MTTEITAPESANCEKDFLDFLVSEMLSIDEMLSCGNSNTPLVIQKAISHLTESGGKRIRAALTCLIGKMCNCNKDLYIKVAAAVEALHNATLLHDDVVDNSSIRRSKQAVHCIWGNKISILAGDYLLSRALYWISETNHNAITKLMSEVTAEMIAGEILQLAAEGNLIQSTSAYFDIITAKTARLFAAACEAVAILTNTEADLCKRLRDFGLNLGIAFQIKDDLLDYFGTNSSGKTIGKDFAEKKITLPMIIAYNAGSLEEKSFWHAYLECLQPKEKDFHQAKIYMNLHDVNNKVLQIAAAYQNKAQGCLRDFVHKPYYEHLLAVLHMSTNREQ